MTTYNNIFAKVNVSAAKSKSVTDDSHTANTHAHVGHKWIKLVLNK